MNETTELIVRDESVRLGALQLTSPQDVINRATMIAQELAKIVESRKLYSNISGKKFVRVEGWSTMGAMLGVLPREKSCIEHDSGDFEAVVELIRASDGAVIGQGSAIVGMDEPTWGSARATPAGQWRSPVPRARLSAWASRGSSPWQGTR